MAKTKVTGLAINLQAGTDNTYYATWSWSRSHTKEYEYHWYYGTGQGVWFIGSDGTTRVKNCTYSPPENAVRIQCTVKPVSETHKVNNKDTNYWTGCWCTKVTKNLPNAPELPEVPSVPTVTIDGFALTGSVEYYGTGTSIEFETVQDNSKSLGTTVVAVRTNHAEFQKNISAGSVYKVRARAIKDDLRSEWSEYSNSEATIPSTPVANQYSAIFASAMSANEAAVTWPAVSNATGYNIEYTLDPTHFDSGGDVQSISVGNVTTGYVTGLETGRAWYFRIQASNDVGVSGWSEIVSCTLGAVPSPPTTWASASSVMVGESVRLNWVHNSEDGSQQDDAQVYISLSNGTSRTETIAGTTSSYTINTAGYQDNTTISWRVRTKGVLPTYSNWSTTRTIKVYAPASLSISGLPATLTSFPLQFSLAMGQSSQSPISYSLSIKADRAYDTLDVQGNRQHISKGQEVFSKYYDSRSNPLAIRLSAGDINLDNSIPYIVTATVATNGGLTDDATGRFTVSWSDAGEDPDAEIGMNNADAVSTIIRPYCENDNGTLINNVTLSVYRREFDGQLTELATGIQNNRRKVIVDPHPSLDYARYRIVAIKTNTGAVTFYDVPGYPIQEKAIILQWDEAWQPFEVDDDDDENFTREEPPWSGSLLRLPYNIDVSDKNDIDINKTEYIGRRHPVSYYGTQVGQTATWNVDIPRDDLETLYALRRLSVWMGDVYVREPSGSGYWATVQVSFSQKHKDVVIPITINLTRVEGGI